MNKVFAAITLVGVVVGFVAYFLYIWNVNFDTHNFEGEVTVTVMVVCIVFLAMCFTSFYFLKEMLLALSTFCTLTWLPHAIKYIVEST